MSTQKKVDPTAWIKHKDTVESRHHVHTLLDLLNQVRMESRFIDYAILAGQLKEDIGVALTEAKEQIMRGEEYTGFSYINDCIYLYVQVAEQLVLDYVDQVMNWHTQVYMMMKAQFMMRKFFENHN